MKNSFFESERLCQSAFSSHSNYYHLYTPENFESFLLSEKDFMAAMTIIGIAAKENHSLQLITYEWMSNHLHVTLAGLEQDCLKFFERIQSLLRAYLKGEGRTNNLRLWTCKLREIKTLEDLRNVIAYNNRNGYLVSPDYTPYSYPWGGNVCFFSDSDYKIFTAKSKLISKRMLYDMLHSRQVDIAAELPAVDGYISPFAIIDHEFVQSFFRDARHYFFKVSRDMEEKVSVASQIGESVFYTDDELYAATISIIRSQYGQSSPSSAPNEAKLSVAKTLHHNYNASNKQIARLLRLDLSVVDGMFPPKKWSAT